jgi:hypothetical protein
MSGKRRFALLAIGVLNIALVSTWVRPWFLQRELPPGGIVHDSGFCYVAPVPLPGRWSLFLLIKDDQTAGADASDLQLFEDGRPLGPPHSLHAAIREVGEGRYSHWGRSLFLSASDNSEPASSGRTYEVRYPVSADAWFLASALGCLLVVAFGLRGTVQKVLLPASLVSLGIAGAVLPFELVLRSDHSKLHWLGVFGKPPAGLQPTLNSRGYRDDEHVPGKVHDKVRILILGDSFTFGDGLADHQIFPRLLAARLGPRVEIIAMARDGWGTADQLAALRREGLAYFPDIVVVAAVTNDPQPINTQPSGQQAQWVIFGRLPLDLDSFRFADYQINRLGDLAGWRYGYAQWEDDLFDPDKPYFGAWRATVREFGGLLDERRIPGFAFVMVSSKRAEAAASARRKYEILARTFSEAGFTTVNLDPAFVREFGEAPGKRLWALPNDAHPGPVVSEFFAREMAAVLAPRVRESSGHEWFDGSR